MQNLMIDFYLSISRIKLIFFIAFFEIKEEYAYIYRIIWEAISGFLLFLIVYVIFFVTLYLINNLSPSIKALCEMRNKNSSRSNDLESKLITKSLNDKQSLNSYTL